VLFAVLKAYPEAVWSALAIATVGNTLGGLSSYLVGRLIPQTRPLKGLALVRRYGSPMLLLSWVPLIGDALCVAAGWLRMNVTLAALSMAIGKFARYALIAAAIV
jgi:membrane protein YqaA with SNARE-associated domain